MKITNILTSVANAWYRFWYDTDAKWVRKFQIPIHRDGPFAWISSEDVVHALKRICKNDHILAGCMYRSFSKELYFGLSINGEETRIELVMAEAIFRHMFGEKRLTRSCPSLFSVSGCVISG